MNGRALICLLLLASAVAQVALSGNGLSFPKCCKNNKKGTFGNPASSCNQIVQKIPNFQPGYIWVANSAGEPQLVYCTASTQCCNEDGGWMRIAYLDMTNLDHKCPSGFDVVTSPKRTCIRTTVPGCTPVEYSTQGIEYTRVCGRVRAYQESTTDAFLPYHMDNNLDIEDPYVDGVSITHGTPMTHIWTFAVGTHDNSNMPHVCPCASPGTFGGTVPPFIGDDYFCESAAQSFAFNTFYPNDPLWDGQDCPSTNTCCTDRNPPWFCREVGASTDAVELRVCTDQGRPDEDLQLELVEIYVQ